MHVRPIDFDKAEELVFDVTAATPWAMAGARSALDAEPLSLSGRLIASMEDVTMELEGELDATATRVCERCGEDTVLTVHADVDLLYAPAAAEVDAEDEDDDDDDEDAEAPDGDIDLGYYGKDGLALEDVVCEAISLALPTRITCTDEAACDLRTAELLRERGRSGDPGHPGFASLNKPR